MSIPLNNMSHKKKRLLKINRCGLSESPAHGVGSFFGARTVIWVKLVLSRKWVTLSILDESVTFGTGLGEA
jgi:hypothetical protein